MLSELQKLLRQGEALALPPEALGRSYEARQPSEPAVDDRGVAVLSIRGPLMHHRHGFFDSYEAIRERMASALAQGPSRVVMDIDSPGGLAAGCFDCARDLRRMAKDAGVELVAHVSGQATSAAYALATAGSRIGASPTATLGSIGVIGGLVSATKALEAFGIDYQLVTSGDRKGDGHFAKPIDEAALSAAKGHIDGLAGEFFELVSAHGYGGTPAQIKALEARVVLGKEAVALGLATELASLEHMTIHRPSAAEGETMKRSKILAAFAIALGLDADCSDEKLVEAASAKLVPRSDLEQATARAEKAEAALETTKKATFHAKADATVAAAVKAGKITPAGADYHRGLIRDDASLEAFTKHVGTLAAVVSDEVDDEDLREEPNGSALTEDEKAVAEMLGLTDEEFAAGKAA